MSGSTASSLWAEGPVYFPAGDYLLWSDIPNNRLHAVGPEGSGTRVFSHHSNNSNGNTRDAQGRRISCEHLTPLGRALRSRRLAHACSHRAMHGKPLNSPNDVVVASDGAVWFTDPSYGIMTRL